MPCPGDSSEICGGQVLTSSKRLAKRQTALDSVLLSLYAKTAGASVGGAGTGTTAAVGGTAVTFGTPGASISTLPLSSATPQSSVIGYGMGGGAASSDFYTSVLTSKVPIHFPSPSSPHD